MHDERNPIYVDGGVPFRRRDASSSHAVDVEEMEANGFVAELLMPAAMLERASLSLLTDRCRHGPLGAKGGGPGRLVRNLLNGEELPPKTSRDLEEGDVITVEAPGGGYGRIQKNRALPRL